MNMISPKIEIINHFDSLINRVDIDIEQSLEKYKQEQNLSQIDYSREIYSDLRFKKFYIFCCEPTYSKTVDVTVDEFSESTKLVDYLNQVRKRTIDELTKTQKDTLEYYKQNYSEFKSNDHQLIDENKIEEIKSEIFKDKFYFQVLYKPDNPKYSRMWVFNLYTFVTDFYMSPTDINLLEKFINSWNFVESLQDNEDDEYDEDDNDNDELIGPDSKPSIFDEKMVLIGLLVKHFFENLNTQKFPSHVIIVRKQDILNIKQIVCYNYLNGIDLSSATIDLSNLEELDFIGEHRKITDPLEIIKIEGLSSLKRLNLRFFSLDQVILNNLFALRELELHLHITFNSEVLSKFIEYLPNIEILDLSGDLSYFSLDNLYNLKTLRLDGKILDDFNFQLFDNLCNQLEEIEISDSNIDDKCLVNLFYGRNFPYLSSLYLSDTRITKLEKKLFNGSPMLKKISFSNNSELRIIDHDAFSNLTQLEELSLNESLNINYTVSLDKRFFSTLINLKRLDLSENQLESLEENFFSNLENLENLKLSTNQLTSLNPKSFVGLRGLKELNLQDNELSHFDLGILDNIPQIEQIDLSENPIINKQEIMDRFSSSKIKFIF